MVCLDDLFARRSEIRELAGRHGARKVSVFGSVARRETTETSDIDLLVDLDDDRSLLDRIALKQVLEELLGKHVDVINRKSIAPALREHILRDGVDL